MSETSKRARAERRAAVQPSEVLTPEPTARLWGMWIEHGQGVRWCEVELPRSLIERYARTVSEPEIMPIALAKVEEAIAAHVSKGVV